MRIAQVAPLSESVPPKLYGGTERVVSYLTEELVRMGHDVTLFASGDSVTKAHLIPTGDKALRLDRSCEEPLAYHLVMLEKVYQLQDEFDIIHFHVDYLHYPMTRRQKPVNVTTLHGRLDIPELRFVYDEFCEMPVVSISGAQREPLPQANWQATIHHALPLDLYEYRAKQGDYLAFLGRISPEKRVDRAIEIAKATGMPLKVAAKVDPRDDDYFKNYALPLFDDPLVEFLGEIGEAEKSELLGNAYALLFPIDWPEPFGLVMVEAMACGTPVVAYDHGSVSEVLEEGITGFVAASVPEAVAAVGRIGELDRATCRARFEERFSVSRMAQEYVDLYERMVFSAGK